MINRIRKILNNNRFFLPFVSVCGVLLIVFSIGTLVMSNKKDSTEIKHSIALEKYNDMNAKLKAENMKAFEKTLRASFSDEQLVKIAQYGTKYSVTINGERVAENTNVIYSKRPTIAILISENYGRTELDNLPRGIIEIGSVIELKSASKLLKVTYGNATLKTKLYNFYYGKTLSYMVSNLKAGDIVTIEILPEVAKKMGLYDNIIEIFYNQDFTEVS